MDAPCLSLYLDALCRAGWLPPGAELETTGSDILPALIKAWKAAGDRTSRERRILRWIQQCCEQGSELHVRDGRLLWCPHGLAERPLVGILSSHLGRQLYERREWFSALRELLEQLGAGSQIILAGRITVRPWVELAATIQPAISLLMVDCPSARTERAGLAPWLKGILRTCNESDKEIHNRTFLSPSAVPAVAGFATEQSALGDRVVLQLAELIFVLRLIDRGRLARMLIDEPGSTRATIHVALGPQLVPDKLGERLLARGACVWRRVQPLGPDKQRRTIPELLRSSEPVEWGQPVLTHWTRPAHGPWPDQTLDEFRGDLLHDRPGADHSALGTLLRIAVTQRLCGSSVGIRGAYSVVCFSAAPFPDLLSQRIYRTHRGRWDRNPYGICISRDWLAARGARAVRYGEASMWNDLSLEDRPFFQIIRSRVASTETLDWRSEQEWRVIGGVDLSELPANQAWFFVPSADEARWLSYVSRWPVYVEKPKAPALSRP